MSWGWWGSLIYVCVCPGIASLSHSLGPSSAHNVLCVIILLAVEGPECGRI